MPSSSKKQHNFMAAIANNPAFAKKVGIPQSVGQDFTTADKGRKFSKGGDMATKMNPGFMAMMAKKKGMQEGSKADMASDKKQMMGMKKGGFTPSSMGESHPDVGGGMKKGGMAKMRMRAGGFTSSSMGEAHTGSNADYGGGGVGKKGGLMPKDLSKAEGGKADMKQDKAMMQGAVNKHEGRLHKGATMTKLANGGSFRASANGIAQQGKTKGTQIKMNKGGMSC